MLGWGLSTRDVVVAQVTGVLITSAAAVVGIGALGAVVTGVLVTAIMLIPVDGRRAHWWAASAAQHLLRRRRSDGGTVVEHRLDHRLIGMHWEGTTLSAVIEVVPLRTGFTVFDSGVVRPDAALPVDALAECLRRSDLNPIGLDITSHGRRWAPGPPTDALEAYRRLIGPLPAFATRTAHVTVTVDTALLASACDRRGVGFAGAAAALVVTVGRVERVLAASGLHSRVLEVADFSALDRDISGGLPPSAVLPGWAFLRTGDSVWQARALATPTADQLGSVWAGTSEATTVTVRLRAAPDGATCASAVMTTMHPNTEPTPSRVRTRSLAGRQLRAMITSIPGRTAGGDDLAPHVNVIAADLELPAAGCGQLIGADPDGRAVTARIWGPGRTITHLAGELFLARQVVLRAVATGARVEVVSDRADQWRHLVQIVGDQRLLTVSSAPGPTRDLLVVDGALSIPPTTAATLYVADHTDRLPSGEPDLLISQPSGAGEYLEIITGQGALPLTMITVGQETALIGRPRVPTYHPAG